MVFTRNDPNISLYYQNDGKEPSDLHGRVSTVELRRSLRQLFIEVFLHVVYIGVLILQLAGITNWQVDVALLPCLLLLLAYIFWRWALLQGELRTATILAVTQLGAPKVNTFYWCQRKADLNIGMFLFP